MNIFDLIKENREVYHDIYNFMDKGKKNTVITVAIDYKTVKRFIKHIEFNLMKKVKLKIQNHLNGKHVIVKKI